VDECARDARLSRSFVPPLNGRSKGDLLSVFVWKEDQRTGERFPRAKAQLALIGAICPSRNAVLVTDVSLDPIVRREFIERLRRLPGRRPRQTNSACLDALKVGVRRLIDEFTLMDKGRDVRTLTQIRRVADIRKSTRAFSQQAHPRFPRRTDCAEPVVTWN